MAARRGGNVPVDMCRERILEGHTRQSGADDAKTAWEEAKHVYARLPEGDPKRRMDFRLVQTAIGETDGTSKTMMELAEGFYLTAHFKESLRLYRDVMGGWADHPRKTLIQLRMGEILAEHLRIPEEGMALLEEVARGDPRNGLVQEAQFLIKKLTPQSREGQVPNGTGMSNIRPRGPGGL